MVVMRGEVIQHVFLNVHSSLLPFIHLLVTICVTSFMFQGMRNSTEKQSLPLRNSQLVWKKAMQASYWHKEWFVGWGIHECTRILGVEEMGHGTPSGSTLEFTTKGYFLSVWNEEKEYCIEEELHVQWTREAHWGNVCDFPRLKLWMPVRGGR